MTFRTSPRYRGWYYVVTLSLLCYLARSAFAEGARPAIDQPLAGTLAIWGGGALPDGIRRTLREISARSDKAVLLTDNDGKASTRASQAHPFAGARMIRIDKAETDDDSRRTIKESQAVWIEARPESIQALVPELRALLERGGFVGGDVAALGLLPRMGIANGPQADDFADLDRKLAAGAIDVALAVPLETLVTIEKREIICQGHEPVVWRLAAPKSRRYGHKNRVLVQRPGDAQDLLALRRAAAARREDSTPGDRLRTPEVSRGSLLICGGGDLPDIVWQRFIALAGGPDAKIVFLPTALPNPDMPEPKGLASLHANGARHVELLPDRTADEINAPRFAESFHNAGGIWFAGGRQWKYLDAYQGTVAESLFRDVLGRGGVIGGSSAGAAVQAEYMVRGSPLSNRPISAEGYERGLSFLPGTAIDIHVAERGRLEDFIGLIAKRPNLLGLALDEKAAVEVRGRELLVVGPGKTRVIDALTGKTNVAVLRQGERFDLEKRALVGTQAPRDAAGN